MTDTVPIATFLTRQAADEGAELLRANEIKCAVVDPPRMSSGLGIIMGDRPQYTLIVAPEDERRARDSLAGFLGARWFLRTADGRRSHSFEAATADRLRSHAKAELDGEGWAATDCVHLAGLLEQRGSTHVWDAFRREAQVEGRTLDEWARACGCEPAQASGR
jgi:hypothetical protein